MAKPIDLHLEVGKKKVFASALAWPGWCRSGRDEEAAMEALAIYADRYRPVAERAGLRFPAGPPASFAVAERVGGDATTDFGAPGKQAAADRLRTTAADGRRLAALVEAAWATLDDVVTSAPPTLRKGPRGGGRDRDAVFQHVLAAELSYFRKIGVRHRATDPITRATADEARAEVLAVLRRPSDGSSVGETGWPLRYAARRIAWHVLDHAWEIEDRSS